MNYKTESLLLFANFSIDDIAKILQNLGSNNAHDNDIVFAWYNYEAIQATVRHWSLFSKSVGSDSFLSEWKKGNVVPQLIKIWQTMFIKLPPCIPATNL